MKRVDALGEQAPASERLEAMTGDVLAFEPDAELQAIAAEVARQLDAPIALVSLVLARTQFFRAFHGLPADLEQTRATDRDASFCQFVVRDGAAFEVNDARHDVRVPQELVERYGISSYLGMPVKVAGQVLGSLCAIDTRARSFTAAQRESLERLANRASTRLSELTASRRVVRLLQRGAAPAYAELRNLLGPLSSDVASARAAAADLGAVVRSLAAGTERSTAVLSGALAAFTELEGILDDLQQQQQGLQKGVLALERLFVSTSLPLSLAELLEGSARLAHHAVKLVGGVKWPALPLGVSVRVGRAAGLASLSVALSMVADAARGHRDGLVAAVDLAGDQASVSLRAGLSPEAAADCAATLQALSSGESGVAVEAEGDAVVLRFLLAR